MGHPISIRFNRISVTYFSPFLDASVTLFLVLLSTSIIGSVRPSICPYVRFIGPFDLPSYRSVSEHLMPCMSPCSTAKTLIFNRELIHEVETPVRHTKPRKARKGGDGMAVTRGASIRRDQT